MSGVRTIVLAPEAARDYDALDSTVKKRIDAALDQLALDPFALKEPDQAVLKGHPALRLRVGDWRVIFQRVRSSSLLSLTEGKPIARSSKMKSAVQFIVTPSGERFAVLPEEDYLMLLAASEDDEGELKPEFIEELRRRNQNIADGRPTVPFDALRGKGR